MPLVTGVVQIKINGETKRSKEGAKLNTGGVEATAIMAPFFVGHSEKPVAAVVTFSLAHMAGEDLTALNKLRDATVDFETDTGDSYVVTGARTTKPAELTGGEGGDTPIEMSGAPAEKVAL